MIYSYSGSARFYLDLNSIVDDTELDEYIYYGRINTRLDTISNIEKYTYKDYFVEEFSVERGGEQPQVTISYQRPNNYSSVEKIRLIRKPYTYSVEESDGEIVFEKSTLGEGEIHYSDTDVESFIPYFYTMYSKVDGDWIDDVKAKQDVICYEGNYFSDKLWKEMPHRVKRRDTDTNYGAVLKELEEIEELGETYNRYEVGEKKGQLQRLLKLFGLELDDTKGKIDLIYNNLRDPNVTLEEFLPYIASLLGLNLNRELTVDRQRREILNRVALYKKKGTSSGFESAIRGITNVSSVNVIEYGDYLLCSNDEDKLSARFFDGFAIEKRISRTKGVTRKVYIADDFTGRLSIGDSINIDGATSSGVNGNYTIEDIIFERSYTIITVKEHISTSTHEGILYAIPYSSLYLDELGDIDEGKIVNPRSYSDTFNPWTFEVVISISDQDVITSPMLNKIKRLINSFSPVCTNGFVTISAAITEENIYFSIEEDSYDFIEEENEEDLDFYLSSSEYFMESITSGVTSDYYSNDITSRSVYSYYLHDFDINNTTHNTKTINVDGDVTNILSIGDTVKIEDANVNGVNGLYTISSLIYNDPDSDIIIEEHIADSTNEGNLFFGEYRDELWWDVIYPKEDEESGFVQTVSTMGVT